ncbi:MAG: C4-type zinc ribbon domain-containing protein [Planctomycetota bacterium]|nr:C4-type zinc ribbon domain-containing protein [Planctomycetota bacterium]
MKDIIERLKKVNECDLHLSMIKKDLERLPKELAGQEALPKALRTSIDRAKAEIVRLKMEADAAELEVKSGEEALKRYAGQLNILRHNKEFEAVRRQMDAQRAWNKENESKCYKLLEEAEAKQKALENDSAALAEAEQALALETERVNQTVAELRAQYESLTAEREQMTKDVPDRELELYNRVVSARGQAIAHVESGICSACFMKVPAQVHNLALLGQELVCCPSCGRILTAG